MGKILINTEVAGVSLICFLRGKREAKTLADYLVQHKEDYHFTKMITSDLKRAETTATILVEALQLPLEKESAL